jgi:myo-inositol-1(or 4)-monophosphatase
VTEADLLAQEAIIAEIRRRFPEHQILTEEAERALGADVAHRWLVDPLDGTTNFARGIPYFAVSIALETAGELQVGVIYDPLGERLFQASVGEGAFLNGERLHVSNRSELLDALLDLGWARSQEARLVSLHAAQALLPHVGSARTIGSAALGLAAVAAGWEDIYYHSELAPWDMAAGVLLIREAGGVVTAVDGGPWDASAGGCLASNGLLHEEALRRLADAGGQAENERPCGSPGSLRSSACA